MRNPIILYPVILLYLFLTGFAGSSRHVVAQTVWAPVGATWHYHSPQTFQNDYVLLESVKDSVINGWDVSVIDVKVNGTELVSHEYIHQQGDRIFYYNPSYESFFLLYNFAASPGDTITVHDGLFKPTPAFFSGEDSISRFIYVVNAIDSVLIDNRWIKRQAVNSTVWSSWGFTQEGPNTYILDGIGSQKYFWGVIGHIVPKFFPTILRCYDEPGFSYANPSWNHPCDYLLAVDEVPENNTVSVGPNPFSDELTVSSSEPIKSLEIFTPDGRRIIKSNPNQESLSINTSTLGRGCYLLRICSKHHVFTRTIIKR